MRRVLVVVALTLAVVGCDDAGDPESDAAPDAQVEDAVPDAMTECDRDGEAVDGLGGIVVDSADVAACMPIDGGDCHVDTRRRGADRSPIRAGWAVLCVVD